MNILLHICCAPCAIYPIDVLRADGHTIAGYFFNPNIHPFSEYLKRKSEVEKYAKGVNLNVTWGDYQPEVFFQHVAFNESPDTRCPLCWWIRLRKTGAFAKDNGFDAFTTTLLGSPYQDQDVIKSIGEDVAGQLGLKFYHADFNKGFKEAHQRARANGIYCQNYCGCIFSEKERIEKTHGQKKKAR